MENLDLTEGAESDVIIDVEIVESKLNHEPPTVSSTGASPRRPRRRYLKIGAIVIGTVIGWYLTYAFAFALQQFGHTFDRIDAKLMMIGVTLSAIADVIAGYAIARLAGIREYIHVLVAAFFAAILVIVQFAILNAILPQMGIAGAPLFLVLPDCLEVFCMMFIGAFYAVSLRLAVQQRHALFITIHGLVAASLGLVLVCGGLVVLAKSTHFFGNMIVLLPLFYFGFHGLVEGFRWFRGRKWYQPDNRRPIVMLRSFEVDAAKMPLAFWEWFLPWKSLPILLRIHTPLFEEFIVSGFANRGPVFAVANPNYDLFTLGAVRERIPSENWKPVVAEHITDCQLIAVIVGPDEDIIAESGFGWEIREILAKQALEKTVFVFPPSRTEDIQKQWRTLAYHLFEFGLRELPTHAPAEALCAKYQSDGTIRFFTASGRHQHAYRKALKSALIGFPVVQRDKKTVDPQPGIPKINQAHRFSHRFNPTFRAVITFLALSVFLTVNAMAVRDSGSPFDFDDSQYLQKGKMLTVTGVEDTDTVDETNPHEIARLSVWALTQGSAKEMYQSDEPLFRLITGRRHPGEKIYGELEQYERVKLKLRFEGCLSFLGRTNWYYYIVTEDGRHLEGRPYVVVIRSRQYGVCVLAGVIMQDEGERAMPEDLVTE